MKSFLPPENRLSPWTESPTYNGWREEYEKR